MSNVNEAFSRLRDALNRRELPFLDPDYYAQAHALFESCSNQRSLIINWLCQWITDHFSESSSLAILSVGCGDGSVDIELAKNLIRHKSPLVYVGVEPHVGKVDTFQYQLAALDGVKGSVIADEWPKCASNLRNINVRDALNEALRLLKPQGQLIVFMGPRTGLNELCITLAPPQHGGLVPLWYAEAVKSAVYEREFDIVEESVLNARIDLSLCRDATSWKGKAILDFAVFACIPDDLHIHVVNVLIALVNAQSKAKASDKLIVDHPVHVWVLQKSNLSAQN